MTDPTHAIALRSQSPDYNETLIIEFTIAPRQSTLFQSLLQGEDGLGVIRCFDPEKKKQQLWSSADQRGDIYDWLNSLPESFHCRISGEWYWSADA